MNAEKLKLREALLNNPCLPDIIPKCSLETVCKLTGEELPKNDSQEIILQTKYIALWVALVVDHIVEYS